jgi:hypothetical protein
MDVERTMRLIREMQAKHEAAMKARERRDRRAA